MRQRTLDSGRGGNNGLLTMRAQLGKIRLYGVVAKQITGARAGQSHGLHGERIETIQRVSNIDKVGAQPRLGIRRFTGHAHRRAAHTLWQQCPELGLCRRVGLRRRQPERTVATVVTLTHLRCPSSVLRLHRNIAWAFSNHAGARRDEAVSPMAHHRHE